MFSEADAGVGFYFSLDSKPRGRRSDAPRVCAASALSRVQAPTGLNAEVFCVAQVSENKPLRLLIFMGERSVKRSAENKSVHVHVCAFQSKICIQLD